MVRDRRLGDEWLDWDGKLTADAIRVQAGKRLFLGFTLLGMIFMAAGTVLIWYLIKPRIFSLSSQVAQIVEIVLISGIGLLFLIFIQTILSILTHKNFIVRLGKLEFSITFLTPFILALGQKFGISYDRMGNSFIKVSNSLILATRWKLSRNRVLILLPRCLRRPIQKQIIGIAEKYHCLIYTVPGGSLARKIIKEQKPTAIIGVACERDLLSGIRDVKKIPVIGIPNLRPEGPCKNTIVDYERIEEAIRFFLGLNVNDHIEFLQIANQ
jgi:hypothetical protein